MSLRCAGNTKVFTLRVNRGLIMFCFFTRLTEHDDVIAKGHRLEDRYFFFIRRRMKKGYKFQVLRKIFFRKSLYSNVEFFRKKFVLTRRNLDDFYC